MADSLSTDTTLVTLGHIGGVFGVKGWVRVVSHTRPVSRILDYSPWYVQQGHDWTAIDVIAGHRQGRGIVAHLSGVEDRDQAAGLIQARIAVQRRQLPPLDAGEYYWADLEGLQVTTIQGVTLGQIDRLMETGANDVMVVQGESEELLIPYIPEVISKVDLDAGTMMVDLVDWDPEF